MAGIVHGASPRKMGEALGPREMVSLLIEVGILEPLNIMTHLLRVRGASHRNHNFFIECDYGNSYFVKQGVSEETRATIAREAAFYQWAADSFPLMSKYLPGFVCFLPETCLLVLDLVKQAVPSNRSAKARLTPSVSQCLGTAIGMLHDKSDIAKMGAEYRPSPIVMGMASLSSASLETISAAEVELTRTIQRFPDYESVLTDAVLPSGPQCLTHNDLKSANYLVGKRQKLVLLDWELVSKGNPAWDVGCIFADYLSYWLFSMPLGSRVSAPRLLEVATQPLSMLQPCIRTFWLAYARIRQLRGDSALTFLLSATKCAGARLTQTAYEMCQKSTALSAVELTLLQTSWNIMKSPLEALVRLFGISVGDANLDQQLHGMVDGVQA